MSEKGDPARKHLLMKLNSWDKVLSVFYKRFSKRRSVSALTLWIFGVGFFLQLFLRKQIVSQTRVVHVNSILQAWNKADANRHRMGFFLNSFFYSFTFIFITCQALLWSKTILEFLQIINVWRRICCQSQQGKDIVSLASGAATAQKKIARIKVASRD